MLWTCKYVRKYGGRTCERLKNVRSVSRDRTIVCPICLFAEHDGFGGLEISEITWVVHYKGPVHSNSSTLIIRIRIHWTPIFLLSNYEKESNFFLHASDQWWLLLCGFLWRIAPQIKLQFSTSSFQIAANKTARDMRVSLDLNRIHSQCVTCIGHDRTRMTCIVSL